MDELVITLEKFTVTNNKQELEDNLDYVIKQFGKQADLNETDNWVDLKSNFSKIKYIHSIVKNNTFGYQNLYVAINLFMKEIDNQNKIYLTQIDWDDNEVHLIKENLEKSLGNYSSIEKIEYVIKAYSLLIPIIEVMRNDRYIEVIDDKDFLKRYSIKRQKI